MASACLFRNVAIKWVTKQARGHPAPARTEMGLLQRNDDDSTQRKDGTLAPLSLLDCNAGALLRIEQIPGEMECAQRLRELGIVEGAEILLLRKSDPLLVIAKESRIAIDLETAARIEVSCE
jgi:Fe2+ transport system protein FeoA